MKSTGTVCATYVSALVAYARRRLPACESDSGGAEPWPHRLVVAEQRVPLRTFSTFLARIENEICCNHIGLDFGTAYDFGNASAFELAVLNAPTLECALETYIAFQSLADDCLRQSISHSAETVTIEWKDAEGIAGSEAYGDFKMLLLHRMLRHHAGEGFSPASLAFARRKPLGPDLHLDVFGPNVAFGATANRLAFSNHWLGAKNASANAWLMQVMLAECRKQLSQLAGAADIREVVKQQILADLPARSATLAHVARALAIGERSLQRRLSDMNTSFEKLLDQTRQELSSRLLKSGEGSISEISNLCGYSNASAYSRAARLWYGMPPAELRRRENNPRT